MKYGPPQGCRRGEIGPDSVVRGGGILCVGCVEKRLGRLLFMAIANNPLPKHIVENWTASLLRNVLKDPPIGKGLVQVEIDGDEVLLVYKREAVSYCAGPGLEAVMAELRRDRIPDEIHVDLLAWEEDEAA
jgi:hypothetical protein